MSTKTQIDKRDYYQLSIAINPGNSGGPVFDSFGQVIGVATLKSSKQESMGFSIPIEDLQGALTKHAGESAADADRYRSRHRLINEFKGLSGSAAIFCLIIDLRRADPNGANEQVRDLLNVLEPIALELSKEQIGDLYNYAQKIKKDPMVALSIKGKIGEMAEILNQLQGIYSTRRGVDPNQLRSWKQNDRRLITELASQIKVDIPKDMMLAFDDHEPSKGQQIVMAPQNLGSYSPRFRQRVVPRSGGIQRPPSLRDRAKPGGKR